MKEPINQLKAFPHGGIYIMRSEHVYLCCVCHKIGVNGVGPHKHNDWLSFDLCIGKDPVIIDPGTYCYTGNMEMRRLFRSTTYHNTVVVDGEEQIPIHNSMFALVNPTGDIRVLNWQSNDDFDFLEAEHTGYERLPSPVVHRRRFHLDKKHNKVTITDKIIGRGTHEIAFHFHLDTAIQCRAKGNKATFLKENTPVATMEASFPDASLALKNGWVSRAYNQKEDALILYWKTEVDAVKDITIEHRFSI